MPARKKAPPPSPIARLRQLVSKRTFLELPAVFDPLAAKIAQAAGFNCVYNGGFVTGAHSTISEPLLTMNEQIGYAEAIADAVSIPVVMDAGAGWGDPLHTMRTVRECIRAGVAGVHIEDQLFPKRAHYHTYIAHNIPLNEFRDKIAYACRARDETDPDFVIIARSDACREQGYAEAIKRMNAAAKVGADLGLIFPRTPRETERAPRDSALRLVYVQSRGNRDGRPLYSFQELKDMGYAGCIDAILSTCVHYHYIEQAFRELKRTGNYTGLTEAQCVSARHAAEKLIGLESYYEIERATVERGTKTAAKKRKRD